MQDFKIDAAFELGLLRSQWLRRMVAAGEHWLMRRFDVVSAISQRMLALLGSKGVAPGKAVLFLALLRIPLPVGDAMQG